MRTRTRALVAGTGLAAALAVGVPVALADSGPATPASTTATTTATTTAASSSTACSVPHPVADYLKAHPDVLQEWKTLRALPRDQRASARKAYVAQHPDVAQALKQAGQEARTDWPERVAPAGGYLAAHPDLATLLDQLKSTPQAQRTQAVQDYLKAHPDARREVRGLIRALSGNACRTDGS